VPKEPRGRFDATDVALLLLAFVVISGALPWLMVVSRCVFARIPECDQADHPQMLYQWLGQTITVLVAIIMRPRDPPPPPDPPVK
jgi:hypothetical protein